MKSEFVSQSGAGRLILVFAGWAMDSRPFAGLQRPGYDIAVLWDYSSLNIDWSFVGPYSEICVVAWSLGVYASAVHVGDTLYCGVTNVGVKPTVGSDRALSETWMPDFSGDLYGKSLRLELLDFIRPEKKFSGLEALRAEIYRNGEQAREIFAQAVALQDKAGNA